MITIIKAGIEHLDDASVLFDAYRVWYHQTSDIDGAKSFLSERIQKNESVIFIAYDGMNAIGFTQLYPIFTSVGMKRSWLLNDLFVDEAGRNKGVGRQLLEAAKEYAKGTNAKWLLLQTGNDNLHAQALYKKNGWNRVNDVFYEFVL